MPGAYDAGGRATEKINGVLSLQKKLLIEIHIPWKDARVAGELKLQVFEITCSSKEAPAARKSCQHL